MLSVNDPRERMANQLLMRGHATIDEILYASFGEWPAKGLDIINRNDQRVFFTGILGKKGSLSLRTVRDIYNASKDLLTAGNGTLRGERLIGINRFLTCILPRLFFKGDLLNTMGHEAVHILQGDHYWRAPEILGLGNARKIWAAQKDANANIIVERTLEHHKKKGMLSRTFNALSSLLTDFDVDYLSEGLEIQARLHEIMIAGYPKWGRLPQNLDELRTALINIGIKAPPAIHEHLKPAPSAAAIHDIFGKNPTTCSITRDLNFVQSRMTQEGRRAFWDTALPALYADMIEMYGDGPGRERFASGVNNKRIMRMEVENEDPPRSLPLNP